MRILALRLTLLSLLALLPLAARPGENVQTQEMIGRFGARPALLYLHSRQRADGSWQMTGEYIVLPTLVRRYLDGERGPELGITTLKEGTSPILFGHPASGELQGSLRDGTFKGTRFGPGGQERERFEFTDSFPAMDAYSGSVHCDAGDERYASRLDYEVESGKLKSFEWRSEVGSSSHRCELRAERQQPLQGGLRFAAGGCSVTLRDLGEFVKVTPEGCAAQCASEAYLEPLLVDRRGRCMLLRPEAR